nr:unnamed protein product [Digitaria exilis]
MDIDSAANDCRPLRPRLVVYTASSSSSSGSLSTTYTSGSSLLQSSSDQGGSSPTATLSMSLVEEMRKKLEHVQFPWLELVEEERDKTREHIKSLVQQFFTTSNSALVLERWFSDLGVSWVLTITDDDIFRRRPQYFARSWIAALAVIQMFIFAYLDGNKRNQEEGAFFPCSDSELFARFLLATFLKILHFVDAIVTPLDAIDPASIEHHTLSSSMELSTMDMEATEPAEERLQALIGVRDALSSTSEQIQLWPHCTPFLQSGGIIGEVSNLLSAKLSKLDEIVWDTVDEIRTSLTDTHGLESQTSPDIHLLTRYREEAGSSSYSICGSKTSGTLSTAYTSSGSHMSSGYLELDMDLERAKVLKKEEHIKHIKSLVREFSVGGGDVRVPERWLIELGIGWVLHLPLADAASAVQTYDALMTWIRALAQVVEIIGYTEPLFPEQAVNQLSNIFEEEEQVLGQLQFAKFFQEAMFKMLPFVDWIVSEALVASNGMEPPYENLSTLLGVHGALSKALPQIQLASSLPQIQLASSLLLSAEVVRIQHDAVGLLVAKEAKVVGAIWSTMKEIRNRILAPMEDNGDDSSRTATLEGSSDIHKATRMRFWLGTSTAIMATEGHFACGEEVAERQDGGVRVPFLFLQHPLFFLSLSLLSSSYPSSFPLSSMKILGVGGLQPPVPHWIRH